MPSKEEIFTRPVHLLEEPTAKAAQVILREADIEFDVRTTTELVEFAGRVARGRLLWVRPEDGPAALRALEELAPRGG